MTSPNVDTVPLCVDLDGTLIRTDVLWESLMQLLKRRPFCVLLVPFWLLRGRAHLKQQIAARVELDVSVLPYHREFVEFLRVEHREGRTLILTTAADQRLADRVAEHVGLFKEVLASNGETNLRGTNKVRHLEKRFGPRGFDYAGNSTVDLPVWQGSRRAIVVNASEGLAQRAGKVADVNRVFPEPASKLRALFKALRPHQWVKNLIIFVPLVTSHQMARPELVVNGLLAFFSFCLCASAVYVLNDLLDLEADRHHPTKRLRPFAAGTLTIPAGMVLMSASLVSAALIACFLPGMFGLVLALYFALTTSYSLRLKELVLVDVFFLAALYTIRLVAGHAATGIKYSAWLLAFSMFIFLSLALVKRFTELRGLRLRSQHASKGRGYTAADLEVVMALGVGNGCLAVLVLALYVNSPEVSLLYAQPIRLLLICPLMLFWISRVWLLAHRGEMHDDPIVFALKDRVSHVIGGLTLVMLWLANLH